MITQQELSVTANCHMTHMHIHAADRAKSIKTKAVVNESATDKLIRELREENARLLEMLKQGGGASSAQPQPVQQQQANTEVDQGTKKRNVCVLDNPP